MKATVPYVEKKFEEFNQLFFAGKLPKLPIELSDAKSFLGRITFKKRKVDGDKDEMYDFKLRINTRIDLPEEEMEDVIIHEMIHYFIGVNQMKDTAPHGPLFLHMMDTINAKFGRHITVSRKASKEESEQSYDTSSRYHVVAVVLFKNGKTGIKVIPRIIPKIIAYYNGMMATGDVDKLYLYMTNNPFFNRFPNSAALKAHIVDLVEINQYLQNAKVLECDGNRIIER